MHSPLLRTLRHQHLGLLEELDRVRQLMQAEAGPALLELRRFRISLMEHLAMEDATIYPALNRATRVRPDLARRLGDHLQDVAALQGAACGFFARCAREEDLDEQLRREFAQLARAIHLRIDREDHLIRLVYASLRGDEGTLH
jgi:hypothetical protein